MKGHQDDNQRTLHTDELRNDQSNEGHQIRAIHHIPTLLLLLQGVSEWQDEQS